MPTLWFSYSIGNHSLDGDEPLMSPYSITWNVGRFLRDKAAALGYAFEYVNLDDTTPRVFSADDIVIGHCWWSGGFMHQALNAAIRAVYILQPYSSGMVSTLDIPMVLDLWGKADHLFLITGETWWDWSDKTPYKDVLKNATRLDMAINPDLHQYRKETWNKAGKRGVLTIGSDIPAKGLKNVAELARIMGFRWGHIGGMNTDTHAHVPQFVLHGGVLLDADNQRKACADYDFMVSLANCDANPTTLLEASAWGLVTFANEHSGYFPAMYPKDPSPFAPFIGLQLGKLERNMETLHRWLYADEYDLQQVSQRQSAVVRGHYTWQRFTDTLWGKIEGLLHA